MKKHTRAISALLLAALLGSAVAAPVSAKSIFVNQETAASGTVVANSGKTSSAEPSRKVNTGNTISGIPVKPVSPAETKQTVPTAPSSAFACRPQPNDVIRSGKFYTPADASAEIRKYLEANSYLLYLYEGQSRFISTDTYLVSEKPSIVSYDASTGKLTAHKTGTADVIVYTKGGVPVARIDVDVLTPSIYSGDRDTLRLTADNWNPAIGGTTQITVRSETGKTYSDIAFRVMQGWQYVTLDEKTGKLTGTANGLAVIRAYSKSDDRVWGDILVYVGSLTAGVYDGYWKTQKDGICVTKWSYDVRDFFNDRSARINGWIRSADGIFLPVILPLEAEYTEADGTVSTMYLLTPDSLAYLDVFRLAYGTKDSLKSAIALYNYNRYGASKLPLTTDEKTVLFLAELLGLIK